MMYTCISLIVHPPFEIPGSAPACDHIVMEEPSFLSVRQQIQCRNHSLWQKPLQFGRCIIKSPSVLRLEFKITDHMCQDEDFSG